MTFPSLSPSVPRLPELTIDRSHLLEKLQRAIQRKLTLIVAPPGYGKTTLLAQFAQSSSLPVAWHSVEARERDVPDLLEHCVTALSDIIPTIGDIRYTKGLTPAESAISVTEHLRRTLTADMVYVMDDIHHLVGSPGGEAWLRTFIAALPLPCHLVLIGRTAPILPVGEMIAHREVEAIGQEDLRFTFQEVNDLTEMVGNHLADAEVHKTIASLNGWPAGTILALQPLPTEIETLLLNGKSGPEALFDTLAATMLESQPLALNDFLLASSTLSQMTPVACQTILELSDSLKYLTEALHRNLFISQVSGGMAYHPLFRDFLQRQLQSQNPERFIQLHLQSGRWFEANNRLDMAFEHYVMGQGWNEAAAIAERVAQTYLSQGKAETIFHWKSQLSTLDIQTPQLNYAAAMIHTDRYQYDQARLALTEAAHGFDALNDRDGIIQVTLLEANIHNQRGEYQEALHKAERFVDEASVPENMQAFALYILGTAYLRSGELTQAIHYLEATLPSWRSIGDAYSLSQLLLLLDVAYTSNGRFNEAAMCIEEVVGLQRALGGSAGLAMALNNLGYHYHLLGEYQQAFHCFEEGLQIVNHVPENRAESYILWSMGDLQRDRGGFAEAVALYHKALQLTDNNEPALYSSILLSLATLRRWEKNYHEAQVLIQEATTLAEKHGLAVEQLRAGVAHWAIRSQQVDPKLAIQQLESISEAFQQGQAETRLTQVLGICTHIALQIGDVAAANRYLKQAITSVNHPANLQPLVAEIVHTTELKTHILNYSQRYEVLIQVVGKLETAQLKTPQPERKMQKTNVMPTYSLRILILGEERVERDGTLVALSNWQAMGARQLFFYLLLKGAASREQIGLVFWPDNSVQQIRQIFHNTIHRARDAVGTNVIQFEDNLYSISADLDVWCDVFEFETLVRQARLTSPRIVHTENLWRQAVNLYQGELLPAFDNPWINAYRQATHEAYLEALLGLGNCVHIRGNVQEAIVTYKRALEVDPYREDIHRALIACYADVGQRSLISRQLEELTRLLNTELGIAPSTETLTLVKSLLN